MNRFPAIGLLLPVLLSGLATLALPVDQAGEGSQEIPEQPIFHFMLNEMINVRLFACPDVSCAWVGNVTGGTIVPVWLEQDEWLYVEHQGVRGWLTDKLAARYDPDDEPDMPGQPLYHVLLDLVALNIHACPDSNCERIGRAARGAVLPVLDEWNDWVEVAHEGQRGWLAGLLTERADASGVSIEPVFHAWLDFIGLDLYACPRRDCEQVGHVSRRTLAPVMREEDGWYLVRTAEQEGWLFGWMTSRVLRPHEGYPLQNYVRLHQSNLVLRSCAGTHFAAIGQLPRNAVVPVIGYHPLWHKVRAGDQAGWIANWLVESFYSDYAEPGWFDENGVYIAAMRPNLAATQAVEPLIVDPPRLAGDKQNLGLVLENTGVMDYRAVPEGESIELRACSRPDCDLVGQVAAGPVMPVYMAHVPAHEGGTTWVLVLAQDRLAWIIERHTLRATEEEYEQSLDGEPLPALFHVRLERNNLNLRRCGSTQCLRVGQLDMGAEVSVLREENNWYYVRTPEQVGWLAGWLTTRVQEG